MRYLSGGKYLFVVLLTSFVLMAGVVDIQAHQDDDLTDVMHACLADNGKLTVVGPEGQCKPRSEDPVHFPIVDKGVLVPEIMLNANVMVSDSLEVSGIATFGNSIEIDGTAGADTIVATSGSINFVDNDLITTGNITANEFIGNAMTAGTATALSVNGANCPVGEYARGVDEQGNAEGCTLDSVDDADADPTNELQSWSTLPGIPAGFADGTDNVIDADADASNELNMSVSLNGTNLTITDAGGDKSADLRSLVNDADADPTNELQTLSLSGNILSLSSGNSVDLSGFANGSGQDLASVLAAGNDAGGSDMLNLGTVSAAAIAGSAQAGDVSVQDASFTSANRVYLPNAGSRIWQSWTAEATGLLTQIDVHHDSNGITDGSLRIYEGEGDSGTPILDDHIVNGGTGWTSYVLSTPVPVTEGQVYTMRLVDNADAWRWRFNNGDSGDQYPGGRAHTRPIEDMVFKTYVVPNPTIDLNSGGIQVTADYLKPTDDDGTDLGTSANRWRNIYASNGVIQTSDARLKSDIEQSPYGLKEVLALRPVAYRWKSQAGERMLGFLAQDVESVVPEAVVGGPAQGQTYGMNYTELLPVVTRAIQEQQAQLEEQRKILNEQWRLIQLQQEQIATLKAAFQQSGR